MAQLQEEVSLLRQMKDMLSKDLEDTQGGCSADVLSATELRVQLAQKEQELDRAKEALQGTAQRSRSLHGKTFHLLRGEISRNSNSNKGIAVKFLLSRNEVWFTLY